MEDKEKQIAQCNTCKQWKSFSDFTIIRTDPLRRNTQSSCRECAAKWCRDKWAKKRAVLAADELLVGTKLCKTCNIEKPLFEMVRFKKNPDVLHPSCQPALCFLSKCKDCWSIQCKLNYKKKCDRSKGWLKARNATPSGRAGVMFHSTKRRTKHAGILFSLTKEWFSERINKSCEVTGLQFSIVPGTDRRNLFSPSVERKDPLLGYTPENCMMVVLGYNLAKNDSTHEDVLKIARALVKKENIVDVGDVTEFVEFATAC